MTVLIAARDGSLQRFIALLLRDVGADLRFAAHSEAILHALEDDTPATVVLVSDVSGWPGMDVAEGLGRAAHRGVVTIFVAHESPGHAWNFVERFVQLPFSTGDLAGHVRAALGQALIEDD